MSPTDLCSWGHSSCSGVRVEGPPLPPTDFTSCDFARIKAHSEMIHSDVSNPSPSLELRIHATALGRQGEAESSHDHGSRNIRHANRPEGTRCRLGRAG